jgi:putative oxidoreductase
LQRLFSNFADGWPGRGLLLQRLLTGATLLHGEITYLRTAPQAATSAPQIIGICAGILLPVGLWTPVAGCLLAIAELWIAVSYSGDPWISIMLAALGASLAMAGPGTWPIDARLFGRHPHSGPFQGFLAQPLSEVVGIDYKPNRSAHQRRLARSPWRSKRTTIITGTKEK